jgi:putative DNA primase/helicase
MAKYSNEELTRWKQEINAGPIIASRINLRRENDEWVGLCPFHEEKTPSFKVYRNDDGVWLYKCFGCDAEGNVFQFVERFDKLSFSKAVALVLEQAGTIDPNEVEAKAAPKKIVTFPMSHYAQAERALEGSEAGQDWIIRRGITMETARLLHLGFVQDGTVFCGTDHPWRKDGWVSFPTISADGKTVHAIKYRSLVDKKRMIGEKLVSGIMRASDTATLVYNLFTVDQDKDVFVVEGEPDTAIMLQTGNPAVGLISSGHKPNEMEISVLKQAKRRFLAGDNEAEASKKMDRLWKELGPNTYKIQWPEGFKDANEVFLKVSHASQQEFGILIEQLKAAAVKRGVWHPPPDPNAPKPLPPAEFIAQMGDQITPKKINWLWPDRVPLGKITLYAGNPDNGKSLAAMDLAARITQGLPFPDSKNTIKPSGVMMLLGEDDLEDTAVPRLMAANADLKKIHFPKGMTRPVTSDTSSPEVRLDFDLPAIDTYLEQHPDIRLIIIDPISNYLGDVSMVAEQEVRTILIPLKRIAEQRMISVVIVMHLNKKNELDAISRVGGAMAFIGVARSSWMFIRDAAGEDGESKDSFQMARIKGNLTAAGGGGIAYSVTRRAIMIPGEGEVFEPYVIWGDKTQHSADEALEARRGGKQHGAGRPEGTSPQLQEAMAWLQENLQEGPVASKKLFKNALDGAGIKADTLRRAGKTLGIHPKQLADGWLWELPVPNATAATVGRDPDAEEPGEDEVMIQREFGQ